MRTPGAADGFLDTYRETADPNTRGNAVPDAHLPDDLVEFVDARVGEGAERSRAAVVTRALERERRRVVAARDAALLAADGADPGLDAFVAHTTNGPLDLD